MNTKSYKIFSLFGIPVYFHISVVAIIIAASLVSIFNINIIVWVICLYFLLLIHEFGHAYLSRKLNCAVHYIQVFPIHGCCVHEDPGDLYSNSVIAWGGILFQLPIFVAFAVLANSVNIKQHYFLEIPVLCFTLYNILYIFINLLPIQSLDGSLAWKFFPLYFKYGKANKKKSKSKKGKHLKVVK